MHLKKPDVFMLIGKMCHYLWADVVICLSSQLAKQSVGWISSQLGHKLETLLKSITSKTIRGIPAWVIQLSNIPNYTTANWLKNAIYRAPEFKLLVPIFAVVVFQYNIIYNFVGISAVFKSLIVV